MYPIPTCCRLLLFFVIFSITSTQAQNITTIAGNHTNGFSGDGGNATAAALNAPSGIAVSTSGDVYFCDQTNNRIRKISTSGIITTIAGSGTAGSTGDGGAATAAKLDIPMGVAVDASGNVYIADFNNAKIRKVNTSGIISTAIGTGSIAYSSDGTLATAMMMAKPTGVAVDGSGNIYFVEQTNHIVRKANAAGVISTIAGNRGAGFSGDGGQGTAAALSYPFGVTTDASGNVIIIDNGNNRIRKVTTAGIITTIAGNGSAGYSGDGGNATAAALNNISGIAYDASGNLLIADQNNNRIRKVTTAGIISTCAGNGSGGYTGDGGAATACTFYKPSALAVFAGIIYVTDMSNSAVRQIGTASVSHAPSFTAGITQTLSVCINTTNAINAQLAISDIDVSQTETWSVVSTPAHGSLVGLPRTATSTGGVVTPTGLTYAPTTGYTGTDSFRVKISDGTNTATTLVTVTVSPATTAGTISGPSKLCYSAATWTTFTSSVAGGVWSSSNTSVANVVSTTGAVYLNWVGTFTLSYTVTNGCGTAVATKLDTAMDLVSLNNTTGPSVVAVGSTITLANSTAGGVWSSTNNTIASVTAAGVVRGNANGTATISYSVTNFCGTSSTPQYMTVGTVTGPPYIFNFAGVILYRSDGSGWANGYSTDGPKANSRQITNPSGVAKDKNGFIYFSEQGNNLIRKVSTITGDLITVAGNLSAAYSGDGGQATAASINIPSGVAVDKSGNVYIADQGNARIRKVSTSGIITTLAGTGTIGFTADGATATSARIAQPLAVAVDTSGNVYFAEQNNHRIRKISTTGILTTVAGNGAASFAGDGGQATAASISYPAGVWLDAAKNIYIADAGNNRIRKVNTSGIMTTIAGNGTAGFSGDNAAATAAKLYNPYGVTTDSVGNIYIADRNNNKIRMVNTSGIISTIVGVTATGGDGGPATASTVGSPQGVVCDGANLYIAAFADHEVRIVGQKVPYMYAGPFQPDGSHAITPCKNGGAYRLDSLLTVKDLDLGQIDSFKTSYFSAKHGTISGVPATVATNGDLITPSNIFYTPAVNYSGPDTFVIKVCDRFDSANIWFFVNVLAPPTVAAIAGATSVAISTPVTLTDATAGGAWSSTNMARATVSAAGLVKGWHKLRLGLKQLY